MFNVRERAEKLIASHMEGNTDWKIDGGAKQRFMCLCDLATNMSEEFEADNVDIVVAAENKHGVIAVTMPDMVLEGGRSHEFFVEIKNSDFLQFTNGGNDSVRVCFGVKDLWVRA